MSQAAILTPAMRTALAGLPAWPGEQAARIADLGAGLNNRTVRVRFGTEDLVVRQSLPQGPAVKLSWRRERALLAAVSKAGLTPPVRLSDPETGVLISGYQQGLRSWQPPDLVRPRNLARLAGLLRRLHAVQVELPAFAPTEAARIYLAGIRGRMREAGQLETLAAEFEARYPPRVVCHNDLVAANILGNGRVWLIDFEYAVSSDPILDLAGVVALNGLKPGGRLRLLRAYYGSDGPDPERFERVCRMVLLLAMAWAKARDAAGGRDERRTRFLAELERLLELFPIG